jgi:two-component system, NarL family, sensor kinase
MGKTALIIFIVLAGIIYLVFIAVLFIFIFQYRKRKIIHESEKQIIAMNSIIQGQEAERSRMAKDLHDGLGSMLSGIKLNLSSMKSSMMAHENDAQLFNKSIVQLDKAITEMRSIAHNMMPEALLKFGLSEALQDYCDGINESNLVKIKFTSIGLHKPLEKSIEIIFFRIVQELSNNAIKHAVAKNIFIQLNNHGLGVTLTIEDDGKGFDVTQITKGAGLQNVQSRIDYLKGSMEIHSKAGEGSTFIIEIPL